MSDLDIKNSKTSRVLFLNLCICRMEAYYLAFYIKHYVSFRIYKPEGEREFRKT